MKYAQTMDPAISGQRSHSTLFRFCCKMIHRPSAEFGLTIQECWPIALMYNTRLPPRTTAGPLAKAERHGRAAAEVLGQRVIFSTAARRCSWCSAIWQYTSETISTLLPITAAVVATSTPRRMALVPNACRVR